jgi:hypothetical protein
MGFDQGHHLLQAFGEEPVVGMDDLAVPALRRDQPECVVEILQCRQKFFVVANADSLISYGVPPNDIERPVSTAIIDDDVFKIPVGLPQNATDAFIEKFLTVEDGSDDTDQWLIC